MERKEAAAIAATVLICILLFPWGLIIDRGPNAVPEDLFVVETIENLDSLDPHVNYESYGAGLDFNIYETLYTYPWGSNNTEPSVPLLAAAPPSVSIDGTQYNITLRQNVKFHDGTPFNASCVKWNIERAVKMFDTHGPVWIILRPLAGGAMVETAAYEEGTQTVQFRNAFDNWVATSNAIVVLDTYTIQFNLEAPFAPFISALTCTIGSMMSPTYGLTKPNPDPGSMDSHWAVDYGEYDTYMRNHTCGTGPYMLTEWRPNEFLKIEIFDDYWRKDATEAAIIPPSYAGVIKTVLYKTNLDTTDRMLNLRTGLADSVYWPLDSAYEALDNDTMMSSDPNLYVSYSGAEYTIMALAFQFNRVNISRGGVWKEIDSPFRFRELRKCFAYAFDYQEAIDRVLNGWGIQARGFIPQGMFGHNSTPWQEEYNLDEAVAWWNQAMNQPGFVENINALEGYIDLYHGTGNIIRTWALRLMKAFNEVVAHPSANRTGIINPPEVRVNLVEWAQYLEKQDNGEFFMWLIGRTPNCADPDDSAIPFVYSQCTFMKDSGYDNPQVDYLIEAARNSTSSLERLHLYSQLQEIVAYDQPSVYIYQPREFRVYRSWLAGLGMIWNPMHGYYWYHIYKDYLS
ncbi:MAG: ABC transporter substrate-binding protein [Promethearchaeota archaeon]